MIAGNIPMINGQDDPYTIQIDAIQDQINTIVSQQQSLAQDTNVDPATFAANYDAYENTIISLQQQMAAIQAAYASAGIQ